MISTKLWRSSRKFNKFKYLIPLPRHLFSEKKKVGSRDPAIFHDFSLSMVRKTTVNYGLSAVMTQCLLLTPITAPQSALIAFAGVVINLGARHVLRKWPESPKTSLKIAFLRGLTIASYSSVLSFFGMSELFAWFPFTVIAHGISYNAGIYTYLSLTSLTKGDFSETKVLASGITTNFLVMLLGPWLLSGYISVELMNYLTCIGFGFMFPISAATASMDIVKALDLQRFGISNITYHSLTFTRWILYLYGLGLTIIAAGL
mmetsp:Transcript_47542/g.54746  ORF Transcript_47542/g.54746 Transcript_47542/m.54746 type:complete len:260 (-) Transcript_47542:1137-1916(-)